MATRRSNPKKMEEKRMQQIRSFQKSNPLNRRCFDCNEMGPHYLCLDFSIFICTTCSGIHREFGHRVKSMSMSTFSEEEVENLVKCGGNERAKKFWRANYDGNFPDSRSREKIRNFIRKTYIDRQWVFDESPPLRSPRSDRDVGSPRQSKKKGTKTTKSKKKSSTNDFNDFADFGSSSPKQRSDSNDEWAAFDDARSSSLKKKSSANFNPFEDDEGPKEDNFAEFANFEDAPKPISNVGARDFADFASFETSEEQTDAFGNSNSVNDFADFGQQSQVRNSLSDILPSSTPQAPLSQNTGIDLFQDMGDSNAQVDLFSSNIAAVPLSSTQGSLAPSTDPFSAFDDVTSGTNDNVSSLMNEATPPSQGTTDAFDAFDNLGSQQPAQADFFDSQIDANTSNAQNTMFTPQSQPTQFQPMAFSQEAAPISFQQQSFLQSQQSQAPVQQMGATPNTGFGAYCQQPQYYSPQFMSSSTVHSVTATPASVSEATKVVDPFASLNIGSDLGLKKQAVDPPHPPVSVFPSSQPPASSSNPFDMF